ncbi:ABC transporter, ATP-binding/permease protein [Nostocoides australiense Ben110]|uniref:ABC transporter, ATP-binding/permease protein n=1 Tax=Nostocoides australiense Ben110 TaxID=1193182 RepID=W6JSX6_9MICO|nr:ABC transporter ATP-binding protein [Tetrasphaera australiensis]CCH72298.1 ABC transporter, ATP-binding/permease protein [Tetrasphaera australiensis Ben110]
MTTKAATTVTSATSGWSLLLTLARRHRVRMAALALTAFVGAMLEAAFLVLLTTTLLAVAGGENQITAPGRVSLSLWTALTLAATAVILRFVLAVLAVRLAATMSAKVRYAQRIELAHAYLYTAWEVQQAEPSGRLQELLTSFVGRVNMAVTAATQAVTAALSLVAFLAASLVIQPVAALAVLSILALLGAILTPLRGRIRARAATTNRADLAFASNVAEFGALPLEMHVFGVQRPIAERVSELTRTATDNQRRVQLLSGLLTPTYTLFVYAAILGAVILLSRIGTDDMAGVGSVMLLMLRSMTFGQQITNVSGIISAAIPSVQLLDATVAKYRAQAANTGRAQPPALTPLVLDAVSFAYAPDRQALDAVSLTVTAGSATGVIGPSGAGKSSLAHLLLGLRRPARGLVTVAGVDLADIDRAWWTSRVAFVPQQPQLFTGTVAENIRFFREGISEQDLHRAAAAANVLQDIQSLPQGFDTHLGERGSQLSGGQRQRISIARALAGSPELVVLDEPTSALDPESEALIRTSLAGLHGDIALVVVAHRMTTLDLCDTLVVMHDGKITAAGTRAELQRSSEFYRRALELAGVS